jgi:hypothetical protein
MAGQAFGARAAMNLSPLRGARALNLLSWKGSGEAQDVTLSGCNAVSPSKRLKSATFRVRIWATP